MNLESQVVSLELAKRLKEFGVRQNSLFFWYKHFGLNWAIHCIDNYNQVADRNIFLEKNPEAVSAFTVAELGEILPSDIDDGILEISKDDLDEFPWKISYSNDESRKILCEFEDFKLSNLLAKMLIHLLENKLMDVPK